MKFIQLLLLTLFVISISCNKGKFTTVPQVKIESIKPETVFSGNIITVAGNFTDEEGDVDSVFVVRKYFAGAIATKIDTLEKISITNFNIPPKTREAGITLTYEYNTNNNPSLRFLPGVSKDTTATFGFVLKDKAANRSVFAESKPIRLKKP